MFDSYDSACGLVFYLIAPLVRAVLSCLVFHCYVSASCVVFSLILTLVCAVLSSVLLLR